MADETTTQPRGDHDESPDDRRNRRLGIASGAFAGLSFDFLHPELILAGMVYALTGSKMMVAAVTVVSKAGVLAPQLLVGAGLEHHARKRPYFIGLTVVRAFGFAAMIAAMARLTVTADALTMNLFLLAYLVVCMCGGAGHVVFMDLAGRMVPTRQIGSFFGMRHFASGVLSIVAGVVLIQPLLGRTSLFPVNYLILIIIGAVLSITDMTLFSLCREQPGPRAENRATFVESLRRGFGWMKTDRNYRLFLLHRVTFRVNYLALAFFIPYGTERLASRAGPGGVAVLGGILVAALKLSRMIASVVWGRVADRRGFRPPLIGFGAFLTVASVMALAAPHLPETFAVAIPGTDAAVDLPLCAYLLALVVMGVGIQGSVLGGTRFLITTAPAHRRISYVGFANTITSPLTLLPLAGAALADTVGLGAVFACVVAGGLASLAVAMAMTAEDLTGRTSRLHDGNDLAAADDE